MIASRHRFHGHGSLRYVYQHGETVRGPLCSTRFIKNAKRRSYRLAVVVSKKVEKSAVNRNRIRRRLYETVRNLEHNILDPYDIVMTIFSNNISDLGHEDLKKLVEAQFRQAGILTARSRRDIIN